VIVDESCDVLASQFMLLARHAGLYLLLKVFFFDFSLHFISFFSYFVLNSQQFLNLILFLFFQSEAKLIKTVFVIIWDIISLLVGCLATRISLLAKIALVR